MERDPKTDPRPGDVLRKNTGPLMMEATVKLRGGRVQYELVQPRSPRLMDRMPLLCMTTISQWRKWAARATVVKRGDE